MNLRRIIGAGLAVAGTLLLVHGTLYLLSFTWLMINPDVTTAAIVFVIIGVALVGIGHRLWLPSARP